MTLIAAGELSDGATIETDLCIIGAGAAGITIARELAGSGLSIAMLAGGGETFRHVPQRSTRQERRPGELRAGPVPPAHVRRQHHPVVGPVPAAGPIDFEARPGLRYTGWPFGRDHLEPFYRRAAAVCHLDDCALRATFDRAWRRRATGSRGVGPLPPWLADRLRRCLPGRASIGRRHRLFLDVHANRAGRGGRPAGPSGRPQGRSQGARFVAGRYVLACGGIENARLLLASTGASLNGLGNEHDLVGRFFMDHPFYWGGELVLARPEYAAALEVLEGYEVAGRCQPTHGAFALTAAARRDRSITVPPSFSCAARPTGRRPTSSRRVGIALADSGTCSRTESSRWARRPPPRPARGPARPGVRMLLERAAALRSPRTALAARFTCEALPNPSSRVTLDPHRHDRFGMPHVAVDWQLANATGSVPNSCGRS